MTAQARRERYLMYGSGAGLKRVTVFVPDGDSGEVRAFAASLRDRQRQAERRSTLRLLGRSDPTRSILGLLSTIRPAIDAATIAGILRTTIDAPEFDAHLRRLLVSCPADRIAEFCRRHHVDRVDLTRFFAGAWTRIAPADGADIPAGVLAALDDA